MSDLVTVEKGRSPWAPADDAQLTHVFHRFTIPLVGQFEQQGVSYLFWCIVGHAGEDNAWGYAASSDRIADQLSTAPADDFTGTLRAAVFNCAQAFAIANDEHGIRECVYLDPPASYDDVFLRGMDALQQRINEVAAEMNDLNQQFRTLRSASRLGVVPNHVVKAIN